MTTNNHLIRKENAFETFADMHETTKVLAHDIAHFLAQDMEELNISSHLFRSGMERYLMRVLTATLKNKQPVIIFPDSVPGFTLMVFKKNEFGGMPKNNEKPSLKRNPTEEIQQVQAIDSVISKFFDKNKQKILLIENSDLIFALFPVADTKRNLKEMDLYITY